MCKDHEDCDCDCDYDYDYDYDYEKAFVQVVHLLETEMERRWCDRVSRQGDCYRALARWR